ncbi:phage tail assembly chaperone [Larkinella humicola]|uniref:phage tail assembly chaperone n=1 Tax=Larkinella humicola TaxID=2607654 RepID=UPI0021055BD8|nr:phage tail assembly chaperone [Larkinella humicola]
MRVLGLKPDEFWELRPADFELMKAHYILKDDERKHFQGELLATLYNTSANRDFTKGPAKRSDFYLLSDEEPPRKRWKPSKKDKGAVELPRKLSEKLDRRFNRTTVTT